MKLQVYETALTLTHRWATSRSTASTAQVVVVALDDGSLRGWGEAAPIARYGESASSVRQFLQQVDVERLDSSDLEVSTRYIANLSPGQNAAKCALNVALFDAAAKRAGRAVYDYLQLGFREGKHVTSFTIGIATPEVIRHKVNDARAYPILKLKLGSARDRESFAAVREVAPEKRVRVDANEAWRTKEVALDNIEWLARDGNVELIEQPMPAATPRADLAWLKRRSPLPLFADESCHDALDVDACAEGFHGVNIKLAKTGGLSGALAALRAARSCGLQTMLGCMVESSIAISAAAQLAEVCDHLDLDGNLLIVDDPYLGVSARAGALSFETAPEPHGIRSRPRQG